MLDVGAELGVVVAYGRLVPGRILEALPMVNVHFSLLPRWRGAAPVERAVLAGDAETGVCLMRLEEGLDTGPVLASQRVAHRPSTSTCRQLTDRLAALGAQLLVDALANGVDALPAGSPQEGEPTYAEKMRPDELHLDLGPTGHRARTGRCGWTGPGPRSGASGSCVSSTPWPDDGDRRRSDARRRRTDSVPGALEGARSAPVKACWSFSRSSPRGSAPMSASAWWRGTRARPGETLGDENERR